MLRCVSKYANVIVLRHFDDVEARAAVQYAEAPIINGGMGHWGHPTQAFLLKTANDMLHLSGIHHSRS